MKEITLEEEMEDCEYEDEREELEKAKGLDP